MVKRKKKSKNRFGLQNVTLCLSTAMVLILLGMVVSSVLMARNLSNYVKENFIVTLTLDEMTQPETSNLTATLNKKRYIEKLDYISKEKALQEGMNSLGKDLFMSQDENGKDTIINPFSATVELRMKNEFAVSDSLKWIQSDLKKTSTHIKGISYEKDLIDSINKNLKKFNVVLLALALILTFISFSLINNTVRLGIYARRFNIHIMKLVGASWGFIRKPFTRKALVLGMLASLIADGVLAGALYVLYTYQPEILTVMTVKDMVITALSVFCFGFFITWLCTYISVNKFLRMKAGQLHKI